MKKSNIIITTVAGIVIGGWSIASWQVGKQIEAKLPTYSKYIQDELWKAIEDTPELPLQFELVNYKRGLFSSTAQYNIVKLPAEYGQFLINVKIEHGPFPLSSLTHFSLRPKVASVNAEFADSPIIRQVKSIATNGKTPFNVNIDIYNENNVTFDFKMAPINIIDRKGNFIVKGFRFFGYHKKNTANSKLEFKIDNINYKADPINFELANFKMDSTFNLSNLNNSIKFTFPNKQAVSIERLKMSGLQNLFNYPDVTMNNLHLNSTGTLNDDNINLQAEVQLGDLSLGYFKLGSFGYRVNLNHLNAQALESLIPALQKKFKRPTFDINLELEKIIGNSLDRILEGQPTFTISPLNWKNEKGELTISFNIDFQKHDISDPIPSIKSAKFNLNAPRPMLEYGMAQIQTLQKYYNREGFLNANSPDYEITIARNTITSLKDLKQQFHENEEARKQYVNSNPLPLVIMLAAINIDDTKLTSDISYKDGLFTINGGKPKSLNDLIDHPLD